NIHQQLSAPRLILHFRRLRRDQAVQLGVGYSGDIAGSGGPVKELQRIGHTGASSDGAQGESRVTLLEDSLNPQGASRFLERCLNAHAIQLLLGNRSSRLLPLAGIVERYLRPEVSNARLREQRLRRL